MGTRLGSSTPRALDSGVGVTVPFVATKGMRRVLDRLDELCETAADEQEQTEAEEQAQKAGKGAAYKSLKKKSRNK